MNKIISTNQNLEYQQYNRVTHCYEDYCDSSKEKNIVTVADDDQQENEDNRFQSQACKDRISCHHSYCKPITLNSHHFTYFQPIFFVHPSRTISNRSSFSSTSIITLKNTLSNESSSSECSVKRSFSFWGNFQQLYNLTQDFGVDTAANTYNTEVTLNSLSMSPPDVENKFKYSKNENFYSTQKKEAEGGVSSMTSLSHTAAIGGCQCSPQIVNKVYGRQNNNYYSRYVNRNSDSETAYHRNSNLPKAKRGGYKLDCFGCYKKRIRSCNALTSKGTGCYYPPSEIVLTKKESGINEYVQCSENVIKDEIKNYVDASSVGKSNKHCHCTSTAVTRPETVTKIHEPNEKYPRMMKDEVKHCHCTHGKKGSNPGYLVGYSMPKEASNNLNVYNCQIVNSIKYRSNLFRYTQYINDVNEPVDSVPYQICSDGVSTFKKKKLKEIPLKDPFNSNLMESNYLSFGCSLYSKITNSSNTVTKQYLTINSKETKRQNKSSRSSNAISKITTLTDELYKKIPLFSNLEDFKKIQNGDKHKSVKNQHTIVIKPLLHMEEKEQIRNVHNNKTILLLNKSDEVYCTANNDITPVPIECGHVNNNFINDGQEDGSCDSLHSKIDRTNEGDKKCDEVQTQVTVIYEGNRKNSEVTEVGFANDQQVINPCGNVIFLVVEEPSCKMGCCYRVYRQCTTHGTTIPANKYTSEYKGMPPPDPIYPISKGSQNFRCQLEEEVKDKWPEVFYVSKEACHNSLNTTHCD